MRYTVQQLATLAHVSTRTLHYYDEIGLLTPSIVAKNGYRYYEQKELIRLQQILFFKELEFSLDDIKKILNRPEYSIIEALREQKKLIKMKQTRLEGLLLTINKTITSMTNNTQIKEDELYDAFNDDDVKQYQEEVKERWGNTKAYTQSKERVGKMTKQEMEKLKADGKALTEELANNMVHPIENDIVQKLIEKHYQGVNVFYECPLDMYRNLGNMYVDDARFTAYYDKFRPGLAVFVRDAIQYYCDQKSR